MSNKLVVPVGSVLLSKLNPCTPRVWLPEISSDVKAVASTEFLVLMPNQEVDRNFLKYLCLAPSFIAQMEQRVSGTSNSHQRVGPADVLSISVQRPNLLEQQAIGQVLSSLDDKIKLNSRMNRTLEQIGQTLFRAWFVDFEPVRAKIEGRTPHGMDVETAALFPERLRLTEVGEIPDGWQVGTFGEVATSVRAAVQPETLPPDTPYVGLEHMPRRSIALSEWGRAGEVGSGKSGFRAGDILFGKLRPYFHKVGVAVTDGVCSTDIVVIRPQQPEWLGFTLFHAASIDFVNYTDAHSAGTKMPRTNWQDMSRYEVVLPDEAVARAFDDIVRPPRRAYPGQYPPVPHPRRPARHPAAQAAVRRTARSGVRKCRCGLSGCPKGQL